MNALISKVSFATKRGAFSLGLLVILIQLFLLVNVDFIYGDQAPQMSRILNLYILLQVALLAFIAKKSPTGDISLSRVAISSLVFGLFGVVISFIPAAITGSLTLPVLLQFGLLHGFVVAYTEELIFRWVLPIMIGIGDLWSSVLFGLFHFAAYQASIPVILFAVFLGFVFTLFRSRWGLMAAVGAHTAWNYKATGLLQQILRIG